MLPESPGCTTILTGGAGFAGLAVFDGVGVGDGLGGLAGLVGRFGGAEVVGEAADGVEAGHRLVHENDSLGPHHRSTDGDVVGTDVLLVAVGAVVDAEGVSVAMTATLVGAAALSGVALQAAVSAMDRAPSTPSEPFMRRARPRCCCMVTP